MRKVKQKHVNGCAIATMAMLSGKSYNKVMKITFPKRKKGEKFEGTYLEHILRSFEKMKINHKITFKKIDLVRLGCDAYISVSVPDGGRHGIAWDHKKRRILDPWGWPGGNKITKAYVKKYCNFIIKILPS